MKCSKTTGEYYLASSVESWIREDRGERNPKKGALEAKESMSWWSGGLEVRRACGVARELKTAPSHQDFMPYSSFGDFYTWRFEELSSLMLSVFYLF